jgi:hypothetical protein
MSDILGTRRDSIPKSRRDRMAERKPVFELHIRPLFGLLDRQHMMLVNGLDLWNYDAVKREAAEILIKVKGAGDTLMPTKDTGGAWPSEWVSLFDRWIQGGFKRLSLGRARDLVLIDLEVGKFDLFCMTDVPATNGDDSVAWFESESVPGAAMTAYRLYVLPGEDLSTPPSTVERRCKERFRGPIPQQGVTVIDAAGTHIVKPVIE